MTRVKKLSWLIIAFVSGFLLTVYFTWPFVKFLPSFYSNFGDHAATGWILWNNYKHFFANQNFSYIANQLYPFPYVDVFIINTLIPGLVIFSPLFYLTKNFILSVNGTIFLSLLLNYTSAFLVFYYLTKNKKLSMIGGIVFGFSPLVLARFVGHAVLLYRFFIPPLFLFFCLFVKEPKLKWSFLFYLFFTLNALTNSYFFIASSIFLITIFLIRVISLKRLDQIAFFLKRFILTSWILIVFLPFLYIYYKPYYDFSVKEQVTRNIQENIFYSAETSDFFSGTPNNKFFGNWYQRKNARYNDPERPLFFGYFTYIILFLGPLIFFSKRHRGNKKLILFSYLIIILAIILSFGPYFKEKDIINTDIKLPYYYLYEYFIIFRSMRVPSRIMLVAIFFVALAVVSSLDSFQKILQKKYPKKLLDVFTLLIIVFLLFEYKNSYGFENYKYNFIKKETVQNKKILFLPDYTDSFYGYNAKYINLAILNNFILANGYSGYYPDDHLILMTFLNKHLFEEQWFSYLKAFDIDYVIFDKKYYGKNNPVFFKNDSLEKYRQLITYEDKLWLVYDLKKFKQDLCYTEDLSQLKIEFISNPVYKKNDSLVIGYKITNQSDCIMRFFYDKRYLKSEFSLEEAMFPKIFKKKDIYLTLKPVILPKETILIKKIAVEKIKLEPKMYLIKAKVADKKFGKGIIIE